MKCENNCRPDNTTNERYLRALETEKLYSLLPEQYWKIIDDLKDEFREVAKDKCFQKCRQAFYPELDGQEWESKLEFIKHLNRLRDERVVSVKMPHRFAKVVVEMKHQQSDLLKVSPRFWQWEHAIDDVEDLIYRIVVFQFGSFRNEKRGNT
jgi:hypothetical protein